MSLGMAYYNSTMAVWEPLIEPNERERSDGLTEYHPWQLNFNLKIEKPVEDSFSEAEPKTKIAIRSSDTLEVSITKTCIDVLQDLGQAFSDAIRPQGLNKPDIVAPYIVENDTGFDVTLDFTSGSLHLHSSHLPNSNSGVNDGVVFQAIQTERNRDLDPKDITTCTISPGCKVYLQAKVKHSRSIISAFKKLTKESNAEDALLHVQVSQFIRKQNSIFFFSFGNLPKMR